ncbi:discoidin domain-containing protein [Catellatospora bangladeshensis]|uniref:discoidin domain-containing protein n=1 Tax=Catellatospora bangladeshensis TaxID=310355 RepID=UPI003617B673
MSIPPVARRARSAGPRWRRPSPPLWYCSHSPWWPTPRRRPPALISQGKPVTASSTEGAGTPASAAVDGDPGTRWSSTFSDPQWIRVDLGATAAIDQVRLVWETAYATAFQIQVSPDGNTWTSIYSTTTGTGGTQTLAVSGSGRYVRMYGTTRAIGYGYSLWEFQVFGVIGGQPSPSASPSTSPSPNPNPGGTPISEFKKVEASSYEGGNAPAAALDGRTTTRWSSQFSDPQWIRVDFGGTATISRVVLNWESAFARAYRIETSADGTNWTSIYSTTAGNGGIETLNISGSGRYLRLYGTQRATGYGYSLWELQVFGTVNTSATTPPMLSGPTRPPRPPASSS